MQIAKMMRQFGSPVRMHSPAGRVDYHAFIQPLRYKNKMYLYGVNTEIGYNSQGHYLYIGPPEQDLSRIEGDFYLEDDTAQYQVDRAEAVYLRGELLYVWAVLRTIVSVA